MSVVRYQENTRQHAFRLGVTPHFARIRRRVLAAKLEGRSLPIDAPAHLRSVTPRSLMATLAVKPQPGKDEGEEGTILLIPTTTQTTRDRVQGQIYRRRQRRCLAVGRSPGTGSALPYGYQWTPQQSVIPDPDAAPAIKLAFSLILAFFAKGKRAPWPYVAAQLNAAGYVRQNGKPWKGDYVRALTHDPLYAGYARSNRWGLGDAVERVASIKEPLIDLRTFVKAARLAHRTTPPWLDELALLAITEAKQQRHARKAAESVLYPAIDLPLDPCSSVPASRP